MEAVLAHETIKKVLQKSGLVEREMPLGRPKELNNMEITLKIKEIEQGLKHKFIEVNTQLHRIKASIETLPEMKREIATCAIALLGKSSQSELEALSEKMEAEYTHIQQFVRLQHSVSNKAEWQDLNELTKSHTRTVERLDECVKELVDLRQSYDHFHDLQEQHNKDLDDRANHQHEYMMRVETDVRRSGLEFKK